MRSLRHVEKRTKQTHAASRLFSLSPGRPSLCSRTFTQRAVQILYSMRGNRKSTQARRHVRSLRDTQCELDLSSSFDLVWLFLTTLPSLSMTQSFPKPRVPNSQTTSPPTPFLEKLVSRVVFFLDVESARRTSSFTPRIATNSPCSCSSSSAHLIRLITSITRASPASHRRSSKLF